MKPLARTLLVLLMLAAAAGPPAHGQPPVPPAGEPSTPSPPGGRISLLEAVRLALSQNPDLRLQREEVRFRAGLALEAQGLFDGSLAGDMSYQDTRQQLRTSALRAEADRRESYRKVAAETEPVALHAERMLTELQSLQRDPTVARLSDPGVQAQVDALNLLIAQAENPDTRAGLTQLRDAVIEQARATFERVATSFRSQHDEAVQNLALLGAIPQQQESSFGNLNLGYTRRLRSGLTVGSLLLGTYESNGFVGKAKQSELGGMGIEDVYSMQLAFSLDLPLGRGRGAAATAATANAAEIDHQASRAALRHQTASSVLATALAYWDLAAAQQRAEILARSLELQSQLVEISRALIAGDELQPAELSRALASELSARGRLGDAQRALGEARTRLAQVVGLQMSREEDAPLAGDSLPMPAGDPLAGRTPEDLTAAALASRQDYRAAQSLQQSSKVLADAARRNQRPRFDVQMQGSYLGLGETALAQAVDRWVGPSGLVAASFERPFGNNAMRGRYAQSNASWQQRAIGTAELARTIRSNVVLLYHSLAETRTRIEQENEAVRHYAESTAAELERLRAAESSLLDTLVTEQQQTLARLSLVEAQRQYAEQIAELNFEIGSLVEESADGGRVIEQRFLALPARGSAEARP